MIKSALECSSLQLGECRQTALPIQSPVTSLPSLVWKSTILFQPSTWMVTTAGVDVLWQISSCGADRETPDMVPEQEHNYQENELSVSWAHLCMSVPHCACWKVLCGFHFTQLHCWKYRSNTLVILAVPLQGVMYCNSKDVVLEGK